MLTVFLSFVIILRYLFVIESNSTFKSQAYWNQTPLY